MGSGLRSVRQPACVGARLGRATVPLLRFRRGARNRASSHASLPGRRTDRICCAARAWRSIDRPRHALPTELCRGGIGSRPLVSIESGSCAFDPWRELGLPLSAAGCRSARSRVFRGRLALEWSYQLYITADSQIVRIGFPLTPIISHSVPERTGENISPRTFSASPPRPAATRRARSPRLRRRSAGYRG